MVQTRLHKHSLSKAEQAVSNVASRASVRDPIDEFQEVYGSRAASADFRQQLGSDFSQSGQFQPPIQAKPSFRGLSQELAAESQPVQLREEENKTGLPDDLKAGVESLSGFSLDDVRVHYNSSKPAQLQALAYTQGTEIHVGPGQEKHLAHEAWHVIQQAQGRVRATGKTNAGKNVCDDPELEREAERIGERVSGSTVAGGKLGEIGEATDFGMSVGRGRHSERVAAKAAHGMVVQMAGQGDYVGLASGYGIKKPDRYELTQYLNKKIPSTAPKLVGTVEGGANDIIESLEKGGIVVSAEEREKIEALGRKWREATYIIISSATAELTNSGLTDVKVGTHTALYGDQVARGRLKKVAWELGKNARVEADDRESGSREKGYRAEDFFKTHRKRWGGLKDGITAEMIEEEFTTFLREVTVDQKLQVIFQLNQLKTWLMNSDVVYVAMSVLIVYGTDRNHRAVGRAVPIDFEHPITIEQYGTDEFNKAKEGAITGIQTLVNKLTDLVQLSIS